MTIGKIAIAIAMICALGATDRYPRAVHFDYIDLPRTLPDLAAVSTIAGSGRSGTADGTASMAQFVEPMGLAADRNGTIYVCDRYGQRIRRIDRNGSVSTVAGGGSQLGPGLAVPPGYVDGPGKNARFNRPTGIAVAADGTLFVADAGNHVVRAIKNGVVSTYAGDAGKAGHLDGTRQVATFADPTALTLDGYGNLYVADYPVLRKIAPGGKVNTILTPEPVISLASAVNDGNREVIIALHDYILLIDGRNEALIRQRALREVESQEVSGELAGVAAYDDRSLVYVDTLAQIVRFHTLLPKDDYTRPIAGSPLQRNYSRGGGYEDGPGDRAKFSDPTGIAILPDGSIAVSDTGNRRIRRLSKFNIETAGKEEDAQSEFPPVPPRRDEFRILLLGDSYIWTNVAWHESVGGIVADRLSALTRSCKKHATVYVVRRVGLLPAPGFEYIDEVLGSGIASMIVYALPEGGQSGGQLTTMLKTSRDLLKDTGQKLLVVTFPESWDVASESEQYRAAHPELNILDRAYDLAKRHELNSALVASGVDALNLWPQFLAVTANDRHPNIFETGDIHLTPYGNALLAQGILNRLTREAPWGSCSARSLDRPDEATRSTSNP